MLLEITQTSHKQTLSKKFSNNNTNAIIRLLL